MTPARPMLPTLLGMLGLLILAIVLTHLAVRRYGGWRVVRRAVAREIRHTVAALTAPARTRRRHRRQLRLLTELLTEPEAWTDAEQAMLRAEAVAPGLEAYGVLLGADVVGVFVGGAPGEPPQPGEPWVVDELDPLLWWIDRADVPGAAGPRHGATSRTAPPLLVALGVDLEYGVLVALLDLIRGPATVSVGGEPRIARAVLQSIAAQLDARLPAGALTVADGVHDHYGGPDPVAALAAAERRATPGEPAFAVCAAAPPGRRPTGGARLIAGEARGTARLVETARDGGVLVHGIPLYADTLALPEAVAEVFGELPPYPTPQHTAGDLVEPALAPPGRAARPAPSPHWTPGHPGLAAPALGAPPAAGPIFASAVPHGSAPPGGNARPAAGFRRAPGAEGDLTEPTLAASIRGAQRAGGPTSASAAPNGGPALPPPSGTAPPPPPASGGTAIPKGTPPDGSNPATPNGGPTLPPPSGTAPPPPPASGGTPVPKGTSPDGSNPAAPNGGPALPPPSGTAPPPPPASGGTAAPKGTSPDGGGAAATGGSADDDLGETRAPARPAGVSSSGGGGQHPGP
ncbi:hypothetical protein AB0K60_20465 [Thermopolyspora sp. NPDC052614]|uniref:hypothetical protein n=1 Tax=Thermopolyspora sp. NPDC052614 TaxID=3155682 RepID=UPI003441F89E